MAAHYFTEDPDGAGAAHRPATVDLVLPDLHLRLHTDRGVFSPDRVDPGTRILLDAVPPPPAHGDLLDLGCGYGPIALTLAARAPAASVWAVDVNARALELGARSAQTNHLDNVRFLLDRDFDAAAGAGRRYAAIWSNPPIRIGKDALHRLLERWLDRLTPAGAAHLVVHRHLGADSLHRWLDTRGWPTSRAASRSGYRILRVAARPTPGPAPGKTP
ncbi:class I SAM-dependent methyltransferase [Allonocardiopsis opalescens]|uniref:16S rRNA (Guanine1207-N2)-methyltransferase n=1 Tax=Allonocardiopsis opalescens TaxID=1144618 RepID=A0A2T0PTT2_9ACTN|nr:methyltransferase [Allonocardiopsis opalescens]PRX92315.1 16S rRNA (guanine1207-N2)-methyltransferase [Allonocardiopsis opalescens]